MRDDSRLADKIFFLLPIVITGVIHFFFITYWTGSLFGEPQETRGIAYDSLGEHLLHFDAEVDRETIGWEGFDTGDRVFIYFGPFPALIRIIPNLLFPSLYGHWSRASCLAAAIVCQFALALLVRFCLLLNSSLSVRKRNIIYCSSVLGFGFGSPLLYLMSCGRIYHEAVLWGLAGSMLAIHFLVKVLARWDEKTIALPAPLGKDLLGFGIASGIALLSRPTFGAPLVLIAGALWISTMLRRHPERRRAIRQVFSCLIPLGAAGLYQMWYNAARFSSPFRFIDYSFFYLKPGEIGGEFNILRIPSALSNYLLPSWNSFRRYPLFFQMYTARYSNPEIFFGWREQVLPLALGTVWLLVFGMLGLSFLPGRRKSGLFIFSAAVFFAQAVVISSFYFVTQRYAAEFLPLLVFGYALYLISSHFRSRWRLSPVFLILALAAFSSAVTIGATIHWVAHYGGDIDPMFREPLMRLLYPKVELPARPGTGIPLALKDAISESHTIMPSRSDMAAPGDPLLLKGRADQGIGTHSMAALRFAVPKGCDRFQAIVGLGDSAIGGDNDSHALFSVLGKGGRILFQSGHLRPLDPPIAVDLSLKGERLIILLVTEGYDGPNSDHVNLQKPRFICRGREQESLG